MKIQEKIKQKLFQQKFIYFFQISKTAVFLLTITLNLNKPNKNRFLCRFKKRKKKRTPLNNFSKHEDESASSIFHFVIRQRRPSYKTALKYRRTPGDTSATKTHRRTHWTRCYCRTKYWLEFWRSSSSPSRPRQRIY